MMHVILPSSLRLKHIGLHNSMLGIMCVELKNRIVIFLQVQDINPV